VQLDAHKPELFDGFTDKFLHPQSITLRVDKSVAKESTWALADDAGHLSIGNSVVGMEAREQN
jgi:hypothetical protein